MCLFYDCRVFAEAKKEERTSFVIRVDCMAQANEHKNNQHENKHEESVKSLIQN